jgi:hypothetical protein
MFRVIIAPLVSRQLGQLLGNERAALLRVLNRLHHELGNHSARYRGRRDPEDPDHLFDYAIGMYLGGRFRVFRFSVNDTMADDRLFVEAVSAT